MTLADKLKEARKNAELTQTELAEKLCVSRQAVTKWETGAGIPDVENLKMLSKVLNVSIDFLLDDEDVLDKTVIREQINLEDYVKEGNLRNRKDAHNSYYLVQQEDKQIFVTVTEDFIESKVLAKRITEDKFEIGNYKYQKCVYKVEK